MRISATATLTGTMPATYRASAIVQWSKVAFNDIDHPRAPSPQAHSISLFRAGIADWFEE
jgi:hypothetical protein